MLDQLQQLWGLFVFAGCIAAGWDPRWTRAAVLEAAVDVAWLSLRVAVWIGICKAVTG